LLDALIFVESQFGAGFGVGEQGPCCIPATALFGVVFGLLYAAFA
jgi:hypothetical protein